MAFGCTVVSTLIRSKDSGLAVPVSSAASILVFSNSSSPCGPILAPVRHRARVDRRFTLEKLKAAEELPIRILHPALNRDSVMLDHGAHIQCVGEGQRLSSEYAWRQADGV